MTRIAVFAYSDTGHACLEAPARARRARRRSSRRTATRPEEARWFPSVAELARAHGIEPRRHGEPARPAVDRAACAPLRPDLLFSFYYRAHPSRRDARGAAARAPSTCTAPSCPKFRGRAPVNWAVLKGETRDGRDAPRHDAQRADAGDDRGPGGRADRARRHGDRGAAARDGGGRRGSSRAGSTSSKAGHARRACRRTSRAATRFGRRTPEDGRIDWTPTGAGGPRPRARRDASVSRARSPTSSAGRRFVWRTRLPGLAAHDTFPGQVRAEEDRLFVACGDDRYVELLSVAARGQRGRATRRAFIGREGALMRVLILGVNGFIGNALTERILQHDRLARLGPRHRLATRSRPSSTNPRFTYLEGDIAINKEWIEYQVKKCDVVLPLVAIATPAAYVKQPLAVFELDFEENLRIVKQAVRYRKRVVFPSTSEVYGMCPDAEFDEDASPLVYGPIQKQRWIYSCSKQLLDRVIWAYGDAGAAVHALPPVQLVRPAPRRHRLAQGGLEPRPDAVPPQHPLRRADQARGRRHAAALLHLHLRRHRRADGDPREPRAARPTAGSSTSATPPTTSRSGELARRA